MKTCPQCQNDFPDDVDFCPNDGMKLRRASSDEDPLLDRVLDGRWVVEEKIGEGGMGSVYRGHQKSVDRPIAIKTLRKSLVDSDEFVDRFFREAQIASKINHPNCVTIYDYGHTEDNVLFIVMEFLDGKPLNDLADEGTLSLEAILEVACDTARALAAAHAFNVVHRDLKPDNIFVVDVPGGGKNAKVLDFGIAKALDAEKSMTRTGMIFGTPEYMSPEQCAGQDIDPRSDLYSLGCILYELVGGRTPFRGTTPMAVLMAHVNEAAPDFEQPVTIPESLETVIFSLLEKDPEKRYDSANALLEVLEAELQALRNGESRRSPETRVATKDTSAVAFDSTVAMPGESGPMVAASTRSPTNVARKRSPKLLALTAVVLLVLIAGAGITIAMMADSTEPADAAEMGSQTPTIGADEPASATEPGASIDFVEAPDEPESEPQPTPKPDPEPEVTGAAVEQPTDEPDSKASNDPAPDVAEPVERDAKSKRTERRKSADDSATRKASKRIDESEERAESSPQPEKKTEPKKKPEPEEAPAPKKTTTDKQYEDEMNSLFD